uniref:Arb2 domain-containing protein n=1 Tax=Chelonoidis abingdonii TaxID=106734 RepID=A0A8C0GB09_CHEAB
MYTALQCYGGVIVLNPNDNFIDLKMENEWLSLSTKEESSTVNSSWWIPKRCSSTSEEHTIYIWDNFISKSAAKNVAFIAHGYGGLVFLNLLIQRTWEVMNKVYSVALIDSMHHTLHQVKNNPQVQEWIQKHCREWVTNSKPLDRPIGSLVKVDCPTVSAGTEKYSLAPSSTLQAIFKYLKSTLKAKNTVTLSRSPIVTRSSKNKKRGNTC